MIRQSAVDVMHVITRKMRSAATLARSYLRSQRFGLGPSTVYGVDFYDGPGCSRGLLSAAAVADVLSRRYGPSSVFDVGCGRGSILAAFHSLGVTAFGCDGSVHGVRLCPPTVTVFHADLRRPLCVNRRFDLVLCVEVAEHLPGRYAFQLVGSIVSLAAERIIFSAAGPEEPGDDHIWLRPMAYWERLFADRGFVRNREDSEAVSLQLLSENTAGWFSRLAVFERTK